MNNSARILTLDIRKAEIFFRDFGSKGSTPISVLSPHIVVFRVLTDN